MIKDAGTQTLIDKNKHVARDKETLAQALEAIEMLRAMGYKPKTYDLAPPFQRRRELEAERIVITHRD